MSKWHASRKIKLVLIGLSALTLGLVACGVWNGLDAAYSTYATSVVAIVLGYGASNVLQTHVETKVTADSNGVDRPPEEAAK